jgi:peroxidase
MHIHDEGAAMAPLRFLAAARACLSLSLAAAPLDAAAVTPPIPLLTQFRPLGAAGNNLLHPALNPVPGAPERRLAPLHFKPGTPDGLVDGPNPRTISNRIAGGSGSGGDDAQTSDRRASAWLYVFGQFIDHDLSLETSAPDGKHIDIAIPPGDPVFQGPAIILTRDRRHARSNTIVNEVAGFLDLSQLYGSTAAQAASLREPGGRLKSSHGGRALPILGEQFVSGDARVNENPELVAVTTLFMREHNYWVGQLHRQHPSWRGERLYQMARAITIAEYQHIIYTEFLPVLVGPAVRPYRGYRPGVDAQVSQEFSTAAFRVGHTQVSETQSGIDNHGRVVFTESLADAFFNTAEQTLRNGLDPLLRNIGAEFSQATDVYTVPVLRNLLFAPLPGGTIDEVDLIAIDIQRERDVGVTTLARMRQVLGLPHLRSFADLTPDPLLQQSLQAVYGHVDQLDLFIGGLAERHARGAVVGPTFQAIIARQFERLRDGDRFYWRHQGFDKRTIKMIEATHLSDIILRNTDTLRLPPYVFLAPSKQPHPAPAGTVRVIDTHGFERPREMR